MASKAEPADEIDDRECTELNRFVVRPERIEFGVHCKRHGYSHPMINGAIAERHRTEGWGAGCPDAHVVSRVVTYGPWAATDGRRR